MIIPVVNKINVNATAFLIEQSLIITAVQTFYNEVKKGDLIISATRKNEVFDFEVNNKGIALGEPLYERYSWDYKTIVDETYHDLSIFKLPEGLMIESKLVLDNIEDGHMVIKGFPNTNNQIETQSCNIDNKEYSIRTFQREPFIIRNRFTNCFHIKQTIQSGFSGGPILMAGNKVVGMVVYGDTNPSTKGGTTAIKAAHLIEILSNL